MKHVCSKILAIIALGAMSCVSVDEPIPEVSPLALVHVEERLEIEGVSLGANVHVDVVRRIDGAKQPASLMKSLNPELLSVHIVGSEVAIRGLKVGTATLMLGEQSLEIVIAEPARIELLWPGSTTGGTKGRYIWGDGPEALVVLRDAQERRLWGIIEKIEVNFSATLGSWMKVGAQRVRFDNLLGTTFKDRELSVTVGSLSSETLYFTIKQDAKPNKLIVMEDGQGAWIGAEDEEGKLLITSGWSKPKLESDCARLIVRDPVDVMKDYYSGELPAHPGVFRVQRKRPGRARSDCKISFMIQHSEHDAPLVIEQVIKL